MSEAQSTDERAQLRAKLEALRTQREAREAAERDSVERLRDEIAAEELSAKNAKAIAEAESKHGKLGVGIAYVKTRLGVVIVKPAHTAAYKAFLDLEDPKTLDIEKLVRPTVVHPTAAEFDDIVEKLPGTLGICAKLIGRLAGAAAEDHAGKL